VFHFFDFVPDDGPDGIDGTYECKVCRFLPRKPNAKRVFGVYRGKYHSPSDIKVRAFQHWDKKHTVSTLFGVFCEGLHDH
jgi:hypothetical protein